MTHRVCPSPSTALAIAKAVFASRYEGASFAYVAGSIIRGKGTYLSDIDLVVVFDHLEAAWREAFVVDGVPVEAFVHDPGTLAWFVDQDVACGQPSILNMIAEGTVIGRDLVRAETLRREVSRRLSAGPPALAPAALDLLRYIVTDAIDDLRGERSPSETMAIGAMLHPRLVELALRGRCRWNGTGKWAPRLLAEVDTSLADRFESAFRALFVSGNPAPVITLAEAELEPHGGLFFDGDRRAAPASWRA